MKKFLAIFVLLSLVLSGCGSIGSETIPPSREIRTLYFVSFGLLDGREVAVVRFVDVLNGELVDTKHEDTYTIADAVSIESFDIRLSAAPTEASIVKMELAQLKEAALQLKDGSPVIYSAEISDGQILSLRSELLFFPPEPKEITCPDCGETFTGGAEFDAHICLPEPTPETTPEPTPAPSPVSAGSPGSAQCPLCGEWYTGGHDFLHHDCLGYGVACPICGAWHEAGYEFLIHECLGAQDRQCPLCEQVFRSENAFLHHDCLGYSVSCPLCGEWYIAGYEFLTHPCVSMLTASASAVSDQAAAPASQAAAPAAHVIQNAPAVNNDTAGKTQCQTCGKYFAPGHEFDTHFCQSIPRTCPGCMMSMPAWKLNDHNCSGANYSGRTCENCGNYFMGYAYDAHVCPGRVPRESCPRCGGLYHAGAEMEAHLQSCNFVPSPVPCHLCGTPIYLEDYGPHMLVCPANQ